MGTLARKGLTLQRLISTNVNGQTHIKIPAIFAARCLVCNTIFWTQRVLEMTAGYALLTEAVSGGVLWKRCFWKFSNNNWKTPVLESLFNKGLETCDFIKKRLQHRCFHVNIENWKNFKNSYFEEHLRTAAFLMRYFSEFQTL